MKRMTDTRTTLAAIVCVAALVLGVSGCATTSEEDATADSTTSSQVKDSEFGQGEMPTGGSGGEVDVDVELGTIFFDFDSSDIRSDARPILRANAEALRASGAQVTIEGHCDERGSEEYNQALGARRASAVKRYLENLGVSGGQMNTVSYGETRPSVPGHTEAAWRYNRNATFVVSG